MLHHYLVVTLLHYYLVNSHMGNNYSKLERTYFFNDYTQLEMKGLEDLKYVRQKDLHKFKLQKTMFGATMDYVINNATPEDIPMLHNLYQNLK